MTRVSEQGSVLGFIVVGILLTVVVVGGIVGIRQLSAPKSDTVAVDKSGDGTKNTDNSTGSTDKTDKTDDKSSDGSKDQPKKDSEKQEVAESTVGKDKTDSTNSTDSSGSDSSDETGSSDTKDDQKAEVIPPTGQELPQTGPAEFALTGVIVAVLIGSVVAYRHSLKV